MEKSLPGRGISAMLFVVSVLVAIVLIIIAPPPLNADGATTLQYIASQKALYLIEQILWVAPSVFALVVFQALKHLNKSYAALGALAEIAACHLRQICDMRSAVESVL